MKREQSETRDEALVRWYADQGLGCSRDLNRGSELLAAGRYCRAIYALDEALAHAMNDQKRESDDNLAGKPRRQRLDQRETR